MANSVGRPSEFKQEYCDQLINHMASGLSFEAFAGFLSVSKQTLYNWADANSEFLDAKRIGTEKCRLYWEQLGVEHIVNSDKTSLNTGVYVFNMKNRFPEEWKDKKEVDNTHDFKNRPDWLDAAK